MAVKSQFQLKGKSRDSYLELVQEFPLASIKSEQHLEQAQQVIDGMLASGELDVGESTYLDALSDLVAAYEDAHHAITPPSDAEMLRYFMEANELGQAELSRAAGVSKSSISEVLSGKKPFSRQMIHKLAECFRVDVRVLAVNF